MKSKLSLKVLGVVITLATLASLLVGLTAAPAGVSAATNQMVFTPYSLPSNLNYFVGGVTPTFAAGNTTSTTFAYNGTPSIDAIAASADGNTIYAWDKTAKVLYESTNGGKAWNGLGIYVQNPTIVGTDNFVGLEISPKFATDGAVVLAYGQEVWLITGGLSTAVSITGDLSTKLEGGTITAMDVGSYYTNGVLAIYIGVTGDGVHTAYSNILVFQQGGYTWAEVGAAKLGSIVSNPTIAAGTVTVTPGTITLAAQPITVALPSMAVTSGTATATPATLSTTTVSTALTVTNTAVGQSFTVTLPTGFTGTATPTAPMTISAGATLAAGVNTITVSSAAATGTITIAITNALNFTVTMPAGVSGNATSGTAAVTGSALTLAAGATTTVVVTTLGSLTINTTTVGAFFDPAILALKLSPNYSSDAEVMAVYNLGTATFLGSNIAALGWNSSILPAVSIPAATSATIAAGTDYFANSSGTLLVGTNNGLYIVRGRVATGGTVTNIPLGIGTSVTGIAVQGPLATSTVVVSTSGVTNLNIATAITASTVTFVDSAAYRGATGGAITSMYYAGTNNAKLYVASNGSNGGVNVSIDNANTFNQIGLLNAPNGLAKGLVILSDTNWYCRAANGLCQSTDKGVSWVRIFGALWGSPASAVSGMARSQNFATNNTFILTNGTNIALITSNGGSTYSAIGAPIAIGSLSLIENDAYYIYSKSTDAPAFYVSTRPYVNATFTTTTAVPGIASLARSGKDATHMTFAVGTTDGRVFQSTDGGVTFTQVGAGPGSATLMDLEQVSYSSDGTLWAFSNGTFNGLLPSTVMPTQGIFMWVPTTSTWLPIAPGKYIAGWTIAADGTAYATGDFLAPYASPTQNNGVYRSLNYNAVNADGTSGATWAQINQTDFPNGSATASIGTSSVGYPGVVGASNTSGVGVFASAATGNTLQITEKTSTVSGSNYNGAIYTFVDSYTTGPVVISPKDKTILTTDTSASLSWTAMNGPAGVNPATATSTNYQVQVTASADFSGGTTPVVDTTTSGAGTGMDTYIAGNTLATLGINPGNGVNALKSGTNYTWRVRAISPLQSRWSTQTFTTALSTIQNTAVNSAPANGATGVDVNTTFTWPAVSGANVTYEFVIAEETGQTDKFAIIDYSATTPTNASPLRETLKYNTQYWWRVRATNGTVTSAWSTFFFTTEVAPPTTTGGTGTTITIPPVTSTVITITQPVTSITLTGGTTGNSIPPALLWAVIAIGAILIIAVIVLIVRTRRIP
jgi:hypothetical protein